MTARPRRRALALGACVTALLAVAALGWGTGGGCRGADVDELQAAAVASPLLRDLPSSYRAGEVAAACDSDDHFVTAWTTFRTDRPADEVRRDIAEHLRAAGVPVAAGGATAPPGSRLCGPVTVAGRDFTVELSRPPAAPDHYLELRHYLSGPTSCQG